MKPPFKHKELFTSALCSFQQFGLNADQPAIMRSAEGFIKVNRGRLGRRTRAGFAKNGILQDRRVFTLGWEAKDLGAISRVHRSRCRFDNTSLLFRPDKQRDSGFLINDRPLTLTRLPNVPFGVNCSRLLRLCVGMSYGLPAAGFSITDPPNAARASGNRITVAGD